MSDEIEILGEPKKKSRWIDKLFDNHVRIH